MAKILVCDDSAFMRMLLKKILLDAGHEIIAEAGNGIQAMQAYYLHKPDLVTMDITMPELDGISATKQICGRDPKARIVMVTAIGQKQFVADAVEAGARDFIIKPFEPEKIIETVNRVLGEKRALSS